MLVNHAHRDDIAAAIESIKEIAGSGALARSDMDHVLQVVLGLASHPAWWSADHFADPAPDEQQARYLIAESEEKTYALYLNVMRPGKRIPPHNHTTWACIAAVEGEEVNTVYERLDDGSVAGHARIRAVRTVTIAPGTGLALMPDDIHSVSIEGDRPIRHLHMYGNALETLGDRLIFDMETDSCKVMSIGVKTRA